MGVFSFSGTPSYLVRNPSSYCFRMVVPIDLRKVMGKTELRFSLRTGSLSEAKYRSMRIAGFTLSLFRKLRHMEGEMSELSQSEIQALMNKYLKEILEESEDERVRTSKPMNLDKLDDHLEALSHLYTDAREDLALNDYRRISRYVDDFINENSLKVEKDEKAYRILCREMLKVHVKALEVEKNHSVGDYSDDAVIYSSQSSHYMSQIEEDQGETISSLFEVYRAEKRQANLWTEKTEAEYEAAIFLFKDIVGDVPLKSIDYKTTNTYKQTLMKLLKTGSLMATQNPPPVAT